MAFEEAQDGGKHRRIFGERAQIGGGKPGERDQPVSARAILEGPEGMRLSL